MRNDYTHITLVLDRSASMTLIKDAAEEAFNRYIDSQRKLPGKCTVTVRLFDDQHDVVVNHKPIAKCRRISLRPRGMTALLDAIGHGIHETGAILASMPEAERPATVIFLITTDGLENSSHEFNIQKINEMISHQRDVYSWDFVFLGANQDAIATAAELGIGPSTAATFTANQSGVLMALRQVTHNTFAVRMQKLAGDLKARFEFVEAERRAMQNESTRSYGHGARPIAAD